MRQNVTFTLLILITTLTKSSILSGVKRQETRPANRNSIDREIDKCIRQLGDDEFLIREAANEQLRAIGFPAIEKLALQIENADREIASRSFDILKALLRQMRSSKDPTAFASLETLVHNKNWLISEWAWLLLAIGQQADEKLGAQALERLSKSPELRISRRAGNIVAFPKIEYAKLCDLKNTTLEHMRSLEIIAQESQDPDFAQEARQRFLLKHDRLATIEYLIGALEAK